MVYTFQPPYEFLDFRQLEFFSLPLVNSTRWFYHRLTRVKRLFCLVVGPHNYYYALTPLSSFAEEELPAIHVVSILYTVIPCLIIGIVFASVVIFVCCRCHKPIIYNANQTATPLMPVTVKTVSKVSPLTTFILERVRAQWEIVSQAQIGWSISPPVWFQFLLKIINGK